MTHLKQQGLAVLDQVMQVRTTLALVVAAKANSMARYIRQKVVQQVTHAEPHKVKASNPYLQAWCRLRACKKGMQ